MVKNKKAFTLVELLAVIVILAVILVIAVPSIMDTIKESRKGALASSAKLIASSAETAYISNQTLGIEKNITCSDVSSYTEEDYICSLEFVDGKAQVTLEGKGKFEGMYVCGGTKDNAETTEEACTGGSGGSTVETVSFEKDSWATIKAAVTSGNTTKYKVGDTKTVDLGSLGIHTVRIANNSHYTNEDANKNECKDEKGNALTSQTACGFVVEFADIITTKPMNFKGTNAKGWPAPGMRTYVNSDIYNALVSVIGDIIIPTTVVSSYGSEDTSNFTSTDKVYLLSTREVWGKEGISYDTANGDTITRQLDYYKNNNVTTSSNSKAIKENGSSADFWWLRSAIYNNNYGFYYVNINGDCSSSNANTINGVSPAFRLG